MRSGIEATPNNNNTSNLSQFLKNQERSRRNLHPSSNLLFIAKSNRAHSKSSESGRNLRGIVCGGGTSELNWRMLNKELEIRETPLEDQEDSILIELYRFESSNKSKQIVQKSSPEIQ
ncbi:hypothetical protein FGO68_gene14271 [Halteria grandinella]|uniref:Uncharacterized protein n=1 Tax=Halteria grandinella TaxID=5974 RepID=A0A8J8SX55_HALGN|nr:hypothetical protein FGO68_gene14271 [Halteria grandinella]